jgi:hypothetical protein
MILALAALGLCGLVGLSVILLWHGRCLCSKQARCLPVTGLQRLENRACGKKGGLTPWQPVLWRGLGVTGRWASWVGRGSRPARVPSVTF